MDPRPLLTRALDQIGTLVDATPTDQLDRPTPCDGWDVRTLLDHLVGVHRRVAHVAETGALVDVPAVVATPDGQHARVIAEGRAAVVRAWALDSDDDAVLDREMTLPWGTMPGRAAGFGYVQELTVHAWDLAVPTGRVGALDPTLAEAAVDNAQRMVPAEQRGGFIPFGPVVEVPADAGPYDRLVGWLGRDPALVRV